ncbi:MAG: DUF4037 domain-containing protein [Streptosporangiaceae bacterium]
MDPPFVPGLELARLFYAEQVRPVLDAAFPGLLHSAALLGWGSDVLGYDTPRSTDHNWGPRLQVFLADSDAGRAAEITDVLAGQLPAVFRGQPVFFPEADRPAARPRHWVMVTGLGRWLTGTLEFDPRRGAGLLDWLATPTQRLAEVTAGAVFRDGLPAFSAAVAGPGDGPADRAGPVAARRDAAATGTGALAAVRAALAWYPDDVWRYVLACQWRRISQEAAFPGRCAEAGDDLGSAVITARLARDLMRLALLMHRRYPPYSKWLGTALARLPGTGRLLRSLAAAVAATTWAAREDSLCRAYEIVVALHNQLGLAEPVRPATTRFHSRPYRVPSADRIEQALLAGVRTTRIRALPPPGAADQFIDSTDALGSLQPLRSAVAAQLGLGRRGQGPAAHGRPP